MSPRSQFVYLDLYYRLFFESLIILWLFYDLGPKGVIMNAVLISDMPPFASLDSPPGLSNGYDVVVRVQRRRFYLGDTFRDF